MKRDKILLAGIMCAGLLLFSGTTAYVDAAEQEEVQEESEKVDSRPDYALYVNRALNCVTVKIQEEDGSLTPVKAMVCSCGREESATPEGTFRTTNYYEWRKMVDDTYGRYAVRFNGKILFHSVPYIAGYVKVGRIQFVGRKRLPRLCQTGGGRCQMDL